MINTRPFHSHRDRWCDAVGEHRDTVGPETEAEADVVEAIAQAVLSRLVSCGAVSGVRGAFFHVAHRAAPGDAVKLKQAFCFSSRRMVRVSERLRRALAVVSTGGIKPAWRTFTGETGKGSPKRRGLPLHGEDRLLARQRG